MHKLKATIAGLGLLGLSLGVASPALAVTWATQEKPVYGYEGKSKFGKMSGKFYNDQSLSAMSTTWQYDLQPGGNNVRVETDFWFYEFGTNCGASAGGGTCWVFDVSKQTDTSNSAKWVKDARARNLHGKGDRVRGGINICEIQKFSNDPCSPLAWPSFSY